MAALQVTEALFLYKFPLSHPDISKQEANQASDVSAATSASRDAQQLLQAVQSDESFTMQVPRRCMRTPIRWP